MAFQLQGYQGNAFQIPQSDLRPNTAGFVWMTMDGGVDPRRRDRVAVRMDAESDLMAIVNAFVQEVLTKAK